MRKEECATAEISVIIPCRNEQDTIGRLHKALCEALDPIGADAELIYVDDGSSDSTLEIIKTSLLPVGKVKVRYLSFSRNFGKEAAMLAGLRAARGGFVALIDADMQDDPSLLPEMYSNLKSGEYDCVAVRRSSREGEPKLRSFFARLFYRLMARLSQIEAVDGERDYRMMTRKVVDAVLSLNERSRYSKGIFAWVGFRTLWLEETYAPRRGGESGWPFRRLVSYAFDAITCFSTLPLALASFLGIFFCVLSAVGIVVTIVRQLVWGGSAYGWSSLVCIILLISGVQLFCIGVLGRYLANVFTEAKGRPSYIIRETSDDDT